MMIERNLIIYPVFIMVLLTFIIMTKMRLIMVKHVKNKSLNVDYFKVYNQDAPEEVDQARQHFKNYFEIPVIFYVLALFIYASNNINIYDLVFAWLFIFFKIIHSYIRITSNNVFARAKSFMICLVCLLLGWINFIARL